MHQLVLAVGFGLVIAGVLSLSTLGFDLTFAVSKVLNIGFIAFLLIGQFIAYGVDTATHQLWLAIVVAGAGTGVVSFALNRCIVAPFLRRGSSPFVVVLVLFGFSTFVTSVLSIGFGINDFAISDSALFVKPLHIAGMLFSQGQVVVSLVSIALILCIDAALRYTTLGRDIRAIADDPELASGMGVPCRKIIELTWYVSGVLGGLAGVFLALIQSGFSTKTAPTYFVLVTAAAFLGGVGKPYGALAGALLVGLATQMSAIWIAPDLSPLIAFGALIAIIMFRPGGILGSATETVRP